MKKLGIFLWSFIFLFLGFDGYSQTVTQYVYYDDAQQYIKSIYQIKDTIDNIAHGKYISYFLNGKVQSKGSFKDNKPVGEWSFFDEYGNLTLRQTPLEDSLDYTLNVYYYKNGSKYMEGLSYQKNKVGTWKTYFENGKLQSTSQYDQDQNIYVEYYSSGQVLAKGMRKGSKNTGYWQYFTELGKLSSEGYFEEGKKTGLWKYYYESGSLASLGSYKNDRQAGMWSYFFENGKLQLQGSYLNGKKNDRWESFNFDGILLSKSNFRNDSACVTEYYPSGETKSIGTVKDGKKHGQWTYFYKDGQKKADCDFYMDTGEYRKYYPDGTLQTKGNIENNNRVGLWEIYNREGRLVGYYKPFYEQDSLFKKENRVTMEGDSLASSQETVSTKSKRRFLNYLLPRFPEYRGIILQANPFFSFIGVFPISFEFYIQQRLGYEFLFDIIRNPFFLADAKVDIDKVFKRGYRIGIQQKFYNPFFWGTWYFGHELLFTSLVHGINKMFMIQPIPTSNVSQAFEYKVEYAPMLGLRLMRDVGKSGFTMDLHVGIAIGYRYFYVQSMNEGLFSGLPKAPFSYSLRFGVDFGYLFSVNQ